MINAFAEFSKIEPDYKLTIYGEGREREKLEKLIFNLNLENSVELPGRDKKRFE